MKISIVIPVYNEADSLPACLEAIAAQSVAADEVIVVDNNSTDGSARLAAGYPFVRVVRAAQQGVVHARDAGFDAARGDVIGRIDADTILPTDWVSRVQQFYSQPGSGRLAFTGGAEFYNIRLPRAAAWLYNLLAFDFNRLLIGHATLWGSNMAITRAQWQRVRAGLCRLPRTHEDLDLAMHLSAAGHGIFYDRGLKVGASMRPVFAGRHELWDYLQWWPRTLKLHGRRSWVACWLFGCLMLYCLTPILNLAEYAAHLFGRLSQRVALGTDRV